MQAHGKLGTDTKWHGNYLQMVTLKLKSSGTYENVQAMYDGNTLVGLFNRDTQVYRWWFSVYVPSGRRARSIPDKWEIPENLYRKS